MPLVLLRFCFSVLFFYKQQLCIQDWANNVRKSSRIISIGFRPRLWLGRSDTSTYFNQKHFILAVSWCSGSSCCWNIEPPFCFVFPVLHVCYTRHLLHVAATTTPYSGDEIKHYLSQISTDLIWHMILSLNKIWVTYACFEMFIFLFALCWQRWHQEV